MVRDITTCKGCDLVLRINECNGFEWSLLDSIIFCPKCGKLEKVRLTNIKISAGELQYEINNHYLTCKRLKYNREKQKTVKH